MEIFLKKEIKFQWNEECQEGLDNWKYKLVTTPILIFSYWKKEFHVHVHVSSIDLGIVLAHPVEGYIYQPISFARKNFSTIKQNYAMTKCEGLPMVYELQKSRHYLLGSHFKMYIENYTLIHLINKPLLGGENMQMAIIFSRISI
jgi:hypothetical protein